MPNQWRQYAAMTRPLELKYHPVITRIILKFRKQFIALYKQNPHAAHSALQQVTVNEEMTKVVQSIYKVAGVAGARMQHEEIKKHLRQKDITLIMRTKAGFGRNEQWIRDVIEFLRLHLLEMVANITETMKGDIQKILEQSVSNGWGIAETVKHLEEIGLIRARASVIARTEINNAANAGHKIAAQSLPYEVNKGWLAAHDERTRPGHREVDGHQVGEDDLFEVPVYRGKIRIGTEQMDGPGDPKASVGNLANCRCRRLYFPKRDANGRLILREPNQARVIPLRRPQEIPAHQIAAVLKDNVFVGVKK